MRDLIFLAGREPTIRADETLAVEINLQGYVNWFLLNEEDWLPDKKSKEIHRRKKRCAGVVEF